MEFVAKVMSLGIFALLSIVITASVVSAVVEVCDISELKHALKNGLLDYYQNPYGSTLDNKELKDLLYFYQNTSENVTAYCNGVGAYSNMPYKNIFEEAKDIDVNFLTCSDGTPFGECSAQKPKYCFIGILINFCGRCGCPEGQVCERDKNWFPKFSRWLGECIPTVNNVTCNVNSDCGDNGFIGDFFCKNNDVYRNYIYYNCTSPGASNSSCINRTSSVIIDDCGNNEYCLEGNFTCQINKTNMCSDGTLNNECSLDKPFYCLNSNLTKRCDICGCFGNLICQSNGSCESPKCSDGTEYDHCSINKPKFCANGNLIDNCTICGCTSGYTCKLNRTCMQTCNDSTQYDTCSQTKPLYCSNGTLISKCDVCGCNSYEECNSNGTCSVLRCSDGTPYNQCSATKPLYCKANAYASYLKTNCSFCGCEPNTVCNPEGGNCISNSFEVNPGCDFDVITNGIDAMTDCGLDCFRITKGTKHWLRWGNSWVYYGEDTGSAEGDRETTKNDVTAYWRKYNTPACKNDGSFEVNPGCDSDVIASGIDDMSDCGVDCLRIIKGNKYWLRWGETWLYYGENPTKGEGDRETSKQDITAYWRKYNSPACKNDGSFEVNPGCDSDVIANGVDSMTDCGIDCFAITKGKKLWRRWGETWIFYGEDLGYAEGDRETTKQDITAYWRKYNTPACKNNGSFEVNPGCDPDVMTEGIDSMTDCGLDCFRITKGTKHWLRWGNNWVYYGEDAGQEDDRETSKNDITAYWRKYNTPACSNGNISFASIDDVQNIYGSRISFSGMITNSINSILKFIYSLMT